MISRRSMIKYLLATSIIPNSPAYALAPFCIVMKLENHGAPEMALWAESLQRQVRSRIEWQDGLQVYPGGTLFNPARAVTALSSGDLDAAIIWGRWIGDLVPLVPDFRVLDDPRIGRRLAEAGEFPVELFEPLSKAAEASGLVLLGLAWHFEALWLNADGDISTLADLSGLKVRGTDILEESILMAAGATPVRMAFAEVAEAVNRGAIDGYILPPKSVLDNKLIPKIAIDPSGGLLLPRGYVLVLSRKFFDRTDDVEAKNTFFEAGREASLEYRTVEQESRASAIAGLSEQGTRFISLSGEDRAFVFKATIDRMESHYEEGRVSSEIRNIVASL